jgi:Cu(I)/Ag(I) efflux system membrane protein CusA/SilA
VVTSGMMELLIYPVIFFIWRGRSLGKTQEPTEIGDIHE